MAEDPKIAKKLAAVQALAAKLQAAKDVATHMKSVEDAADAAAADAELIIKTEAKK